MNLHKPLRALKGLKAKAGVQGVCILRREDQSPQVFKVIERKNKLHKLLGQSFSAMGFIYKNVGEVSEGRRVCNYAGKGDLLFVVKNGEAQRILNGEFNKM